MFISKLTDSVKREAYSDFAIKPGEKKIILNAHQTQYENEDSSWVQSDATVADREIVISNDTKISKSTELVEVDDGVSVYPVILDPDGDDAYDYMSGQLLKDLVPGWDALRATVTDETALAVIDQIGNVPAYALIKWQVEGFLKVFLAS